MNKLYNACAVLQGTPGVSGWLQMGFALALVTLPLLGCVPRVQTRDSTAQPMTLDARWSANPDRARQGFSQLPR
jgi:hypothetical protein